MTRAADEARAPGWARWLVARIAPQGREDEALGDLEESHRERAAGRGAIVAHLLTGLEALDMALALLRHRWRRGGVGASRGSDSPAARSRDPLFSWLDVKLGLRMLAKYPGLSIVSVIGMAVMIALGAGGFQFLGSLTDPALPLPNGDRIVTVVNHSRVTSSPERQALQDYAVWREDVGSIRELSAFRDTDRTVVLPSGAGYQVPIAEVTASAFAVTRVPPLLGRPLVPADERPGAPPVMVIGYEPWQRHFDGDPAVLGQQVRLGTEFHTVVGVMPEGYAFPVANRYWVPLRTDVEFPTGQGPAIHIFGRLAPGATLETAQAELATVGQRMAAVYPETHEHLLPRVLPYTHGVMMQSPESAQLIRNFRFGLGLLLLVVVVNVAILVYARTAARTGEIAVRTALGAKRRRVVTQLFAEALVLSLTAAAVGLALAQAGLGLAGRVSAASEHPMPFWMEFQLTPATIAYAVALALLAGVVVGVLPGMKATGRGMIEGLRQLSARGSQMRLGRTWSTLIVVQVAVAVAILPSGAFIGLNALQRATARAGYAVEEIVHGHLGFQGPAILPPDAPTDAEGWNARFVRGAQELIQRLESEPGVAGVTFATALPGKGEQDEDIEVAGAASPSGGQDAAGIEVGATWVGPTYFSDIGVPVVAGRGFEPADTVGEPRTVIVDRVFADQVLGGGAVVGRQIRRLVWKGDGPDAVLEPQPWMEVVGVVPDFAAPAEPGPVEPRVYYPSRLPRTTLLVLSVRVPGAGGPARFAPRLREIATAADPYFVFHELKPATVSERERMAALLSVGTVVIAVVASVLLLSAAGIYAMMSFIIVRRRREIGIRRALGADPRRLLGGVFARAGAQLGVGALVGLAAGVAIGQAMGGVSLTGAGLRMLPVVVLIVLCTGLLAALGPARRGLAVEPTEALRQEE